MKTRILTGAALLFPLLATADTLTMKNGTRFAGTFNSANATQLSFTEYNGNRQMLNVYDVQELRFGNDSPRPADTGFGRNSTPPPNQQPYADNPFPNGVQPSVAYSPADDLDRLYSDLQSALQNNNLTDNQRRSLQDSSAVLQTASRQVRTNRPLDQRIVRLAIDSIRDATNSMQPRDRDLLNEDIRRTDPVVNFPQRNGGGRDY